jgi:hypothetical protein
VNLGFRPDATTGLVEVFLPAPPTSPPAHLRVVEPEIADAVKFLARRTRVLPVLTDGCAARHLDALIADAHRRHPTVCG